MPRTCTSLVPPKRVCEVAPVAARLPEISHSLAVVSLTLSAFRGKRIRTFILDFRAASGLNRTRKRAWVVSSCTPRTRPSRVFSASQPQYVGFGRRRRLTIMPLRIECKANTVENLWGERDSLVGRRWAGGGKAVESRLIGRGKIVESRWQNGLRAVDGLLAGSLLRYFLPISRPLYIVVGV